MILVRKREAQKYLALLKSHKEDNGSELNSIEFPGLHNH